MIQFEDKAFLFNVFCAIKQNSAYQMISFFFSFFGVYFLGGGGGIGGGGSMDDNFDVMVDTHAFGYH